MSEFKITTYHLTTEKLPRDTGELTFILLADLHNKEYGMQNERLLEAIERQEPDAVLVAGDMLVADPRLSYEPALTLFRRLRERKLPVFYGNGNHECRLRSQKLDSQTRYAAYTGELCAYGVQVLENTSACFCANKDRARIRIYGFELDMRYYRKMHRDPFSAEELSAIMGEPKPSDYGILLAHNPVYFDAYAGWGADLTLSGHLHGGIIRIPGIGGLITPQAQLFPKYDAGHFEKQGHHLVVSRGLGTHTVNLRIFNPAELVVIRLRPAEKE